MTDTAKSSVASEAGPDGQVLRDLYTVMRRITSLDAAIVKALSTGTMATTYYPVHGLEAVCACIGVLLSPEDYLVSTYRCLGDVVAKGVSSREILAEMNGRIGGTSKGKGGAMHMSDPHQGLMVTTGVVGSGVPIANGLALAAKLRNEARATVVTFGDGATSIGAYHEGLHLAALWNLPVVFVCQNNCWGEHTSLSAYTKEPDLAKRAAAYAIESVAVDGFDVLATYRVLRAAVERARSGGGPTFVECITYRLGPHAFGNDVAYMPADERQAALDRDPLPRFREALIERGLADAAELDDVDRRIAEEVEGAFEFARSSPPTPEVELLRDLFAGDEEVLRR
jgi:acetoin:2,6-dichlorophenolindophenol oxidoreductase subunit alpha